MSEKQLSTDRGSNRSVSRGERGTGKLAMRRRRSRRRIFAALGVLFILLCVGIIYELNQDATRISHIQIFGADQSFADSARAAMRGSYFGIIPRDSTFFFPASRIRTDISAARPDIAAISIFRNGLTGLSIKVDERVPIARWCGSPPSTLATSTLSSGICYLFDASGFVYATTSPSEPINPFTVYESASSTETPIGLTLPNAEKLPAALDFARQLDTFGSPVSSVVFRGDEVDDYLKSGTRITYVLGNEQSAFTALVSARGNMNLADGSLEYVDLRFGGKVYLKKK